MNIFILSLNPYLCAIFHCDKHVVKMILETAQMLCTCHHLCSNNNNNKSLYKQAFQNHPCTIWARQTTGNYCWLYMLFYNLCKEYTYRYNKIHTCEKKLIDVLNYIPNNISEGNITKFAQAMPDDVKNNNSVIAYRNYYMKYKKDFCKWTKRDTPSWFLIN